MKSVIVRSTVYTAPLFVLYSTRYCVRGDPPEFAGPNVTLACLSSAVATSALTLPGTPTGIALCVAVFVLFPAAVFATTLTATETPLVKPVMS